VWIQQLELIVFLDACLLSWLGWNPARTTDRRTDRQTVVFDEVY